MRESGIYQMYLKNLLDRLLALVGTAALSWLLILLGIAIHLDSPGPIFFPAIGAVSVACRTLRHAVQYIAADRNLRILEEFQCPLYFTVLGSSLVYDKNCRICDSAQKGCIRQYSARRRWTEICEIRRY